MKHKKELDEFLNQVKLRMEEGAVEYGEKSYDKPLPALIKEIQEELEDVAGWASIMWARLEKLWRDEEEPAT